MKLTQKDKRFVFFTAIASLLILASMHLLPQAQAENPAPIPASLQQEVASAIKPMTAADLEHLITNSQGKRTMVMFYTSWCPYCRTALPQVLAWQKAGALNDTQLVLLSIDKKPQQLIDYLGGEQYHKAFTPYLFQPQSATAMPALLQKYGMDFNGGIPYAAVISADGKLLAQTTAGKGWDDINALVNAE